MIKQVLCSIFLIYQLSANRLLLQITQTGNNQPPVIPDRVQPSIPTDRVPPVIPDRVPQPQPQVVPPITPPQVQTQPVAPAGFEFGAYGQQCPIPRTAGQCVSITDSINDAGQGRVRCVAQSDCCMCNSIECGFIGEECRSLRFGPSAALGVQHIKAVGSLAGFGTFIACQGADSCNGANIISDYTAEVDCNGENACAGAVMTINNPKPHFALECTGSNSCNGLRIDITIDEPAGGCLGIAAGLFDMSGIECTGNGACEGLKVNIINNGCSSVLMQDLDCVSTNACTNAIFNFIGHVEIQNCQCGPSCNSAIGLEQCFNNVAELRCPDALSCMGQIQTITNPMNGFEFSCGNVQSCENANMVFDLIASADRPAPITEWRLFEFTGENSARGATFTVNNNQGENPVTGLPIVLNIEAIECAGYGSCVNTRFITGINVLIGEIICASDACDGCTVDGVACDNRQGQNPYQIIEPMLPVPPIVPPQAQAQPQPVQQQPQWVAPVLPVVPAVPQPQPQWLPVQV